MLVFYLCCGVTVNQYESKCVNTLKTIKIQVQC